MRRFVGAWTAGKRYHWEKYHENYTDHVKLAIERKQIRSLMQLLLSSSSGFTVESSSAATVLLASKLGIPISSTHCIVGSVVFVGWLHTKDEQKVDWSLFRSIIYAWLITLPAAASVSALLMLVFKYTLLH